MALVPEAILEKLEPMTVTFRYLSVAPQTHLAPPEGVAGSNRACLPL